MVDKSVNPPIIVGVDGTQEGLRAVDYAVDEAVRRGCPVVLVHAYREHAQLTPYMATYDMDSEKEIGARALTEARAAVTSRTRNLEVSERLVTGWAGHELAHLAANARLVVLGRTPLTGLERLAAGSVAVSVAARSTVPVVSVPCAWTDQGHRGVVVGTSERPSQAALRVAFEEADLLGAPVLAVRAWEPPASWSSEVPVPHDLSQLWTVETERALAEELAGWSEEFPGVKVERHVASTDAKHALLEAAVDARLVVVASRRVGELLHLRLGSTARTLLSHAPCPVMIVPARQAKHFGRRRYRDAPDVVTPLY